MSADLPAFVTLLQRLTETNEKSSLNSACTQLRRFSTIFDLRWCDRVKALPDTRQIVNIYDLIEVMVKLAHANEMSLVHDKYLM